MEFFWFMITYVLVNIVFYRDQFIIPPVHDIQITDACEQDIVMSYSATLPVKVWIGGSTLIP